MVAAAILALATSAPAEIIGVETFDYPDGPIAGKTAGTFWDFKNFPPTGHDGTASDWDNSTGAPVVTASKLVTDNNSAKREHNGPGDEADGAVNDPASAPSSGAKVVYSSVSVTTGATLPTFFGVSLFDFASEMVFFGLGTGQASFGIGTFNGFGTATSSSLVAANATYTFVTRIDYTANTLRLFNNPDLNAAEPATADSTLTNYTATNWTTSVRLASFGTTFVRYVPIMSAAGRRTVMLAPAPPLL